MVKPTVLFLCPDNRLLGQMAEAYFNARAGELMRAFSAGMSPAGGVHRAVFRLLSALNIEATGLQPKSVDVFLMPHSVVPDRVVYLTDMDEITQIAAWERTTSSHWWNIAPPPPFPDDFPSCAAYLDQIKASIDELVDPLTTAAFKAQ